MRLSKPYQNQMMFSLKTLQKLVFVLEMYDVKSQNLKNMYKKTIRKAIFIFLSFSK
jgi:hypothetical protein